MPLKKISLFAAFLIITGIAFYSCQKDYGQPTDANSIYFGSRSGVAIRAVLLAQIPSTDPAGNSWDVPDSLDAFGLPDVYYRIADADSLDFPPYAQAFQFENLSPDSLPIPYYLTTPYQVRAFGSSVLFDIYDYEKNANNADYDSTLMHSFTFTISPGDSLLGNPYPDSVFLSQDGYSVFLFLNWIK
jgi:hypothetical protein